MPWPRALRSPRPTLDARLLDAATQAQPATIELLKRMTMIESGSGDAAGLAKMADLVGDRLEPLGFKTERRKSPAGVGADVVIATMTGTARATSCRRVTWMPSTVPVR